MPEHETQNLKLKYDAMLKTYQALSRQYEELKSAYQALQAPPDQSTINLVEATLQELLDSHADLITLQDRDKPDLDLSPIQQHLESLGMFARTDALAQELPEILQNASTNQSTKEEYAILQDSFSAIAKAAAQ